MPLGKSNVAGNCSSGPASCTSVFLKLPGARLISVRRFLLDPPGRNRHDPRPRSECKWHAEIIYGRETTGRTWLVWMPFPHYVCDLVALKVLQANRGATERNGWRAQVSVVCRPGRSETPSLVSAWNADESKHTGCRVGLETDANVTAGYIKQTNLAAEIAASFLVQLHLNSNSNNQNCLYRSFWMLVLQSHSYSFSLNWWFSFEHGFPSCTCRTCPHKQAQALKRILPVPKFSPTKATRLGSFPPTDAGLSYF